MPRVSVVLPNYNYARYLKERVRSILTQTVQDFELIYMDDASKDSSNLVMQEFAGDPRLKMHLFEQNSGTVYRRWNEGAALAKGQWLWFAGADDSASGRFLEQLLALAEAHPSAALLFARPVTMDSDGSITTTHCNWHCGAMMEMKGTYFNRGHQELIPNTEGCYLSTASSLLIRRDAFEAVGGFDLRLWGVSDWDLYLKLLQDYDIAYTSEPLSYFRQHGGNVTTATKSTLINLANAYCIAGAYQRMLDDPRHPRSAKDLVLRRAKSRVFDLFADPQLQIPESMGFAVQQVFSVVPDKRLLRHMPASNAQPLQ